MGNIHFIGRLILMTLLIHIDQFLYGSMVSQSSKRTLILVNSWDSFQDIELWLTRESTPTPI